MSQSNEREQLILRSRQLKILLCTLESYCKAAFENDTARLDRLVSYQIPHEAMVEEIKFSQKANNSLSVLLSAVKESVLMENEAIKKEERRL